VVCRYYLGISPGKVVIALYPVIALRCRVRINARIEGQATTKLFDSAFFDPVLKEY
jgi:hypothetical protein